LYNSFQNIKISVDDVGYYIVKCKLKDFNISINKLKVIGRITVNSIESDYIIDPIGTIETQMGDFYKTGSFGQNRDCMFLIKGDWSYEKTF